jgi:hypothetical protein
MSKMDSSNLHLSTLFQTLVTALNMRFFVYIALISASPLVAEEKDYNPFEKKIEWAIDGVKGFYDGYYT